MESCIKLRPSFPLRNGGFLCIPRAQLKRYEADVKQMCCQVCEAEGFRLNRSVEAFKKAVLEDPILKMCMTGGLNAIPKNGVLFECSVDKVFDMINSVIAVPQPAKHKGLEGVPFYALFCDFLQTLGGMGFFSNPIVNEHLKNVFNEFSIMLDSTKSLKYLNTKKDGGWLYEGDGKNNPKPSYNRIDYKRFICDTSKPHYGFTSWNDWFTRRLNLNDPFNKVEGDENVIVNSSDSFPLYYPPNKDNKKEGTNPTYNVAYNAQFWLKDVQYSLGDMLGAKEMGIQQFVKDTFEGGTVYQAFLNPWCYHRWHAPVAGTIMYSYKLGGTYYFQNPSLKLDIKKDNYVDSQPLLSTISVRQVYIIKATNANIGHVAVIEIGMAEVSSINSVVTQNQCLDKGAQLGYFAFGGSSYVMIFSNNLKEEKSAKKGEFFLKWAEDTFTPVSSEVPGQPDAPYKVFVNKKLVQICKKK